MSANGSVKWSSVCPTTDVLKIELHLKGAIDPNEAKAESTALLLRKTKKQTNLKYQVPIVVTVMMFLFPNESF